MRAMDNRVHRLIVATLCLAVAGGCSTTPTDDAAYIVDGVKYGVTEGKFRGRWWSYYERGRSFQDGGFLTEAEEDLRKALAGRAIDQHWPRTYGLHFIPEYFPHRELGITFFLQDRVEEALDELEASLDQQYSARGAYYLDEARRAWLDANDTDREAPKIVLTATPAPVVGDMRVTLTGRATDDTFVSEITVDGEAYRIPVSAAEVTFNKEVSLQPGDNSIEIVARDLLGRESSLMVTVASDVDGPAVSFDRPVVLPGSVSGIAYDPSGVAAIEIGGETASFTDMGDGKVAFSVQLAETDLEAPLTYVCRDGHGNPTRGNVRPEGLALTDLAGAVVPAGAALREVPLGGGLRGLMLGDNLIAAVAAPAPVTSRVRFYNLSEGAKYRLPEIVVTLDIESAAPIAELTLNDAPLAIIPGRRTQQVGRRFELAMGANNFFAKLRGTDQSQAEASVEVERVPTVLEQLGNRLSMAVLGNVWKSSGPVPESEKLDVLNTLRRELAYQGRFQLVTREELLLPILTDKELVAAMGSNESRKRLKSVAGAEVMLIGQVRKDAHSIEIIAEVFSSETSELLVHTEAAGPATSRDALQRLVKDLALQIIQEFPRAEGYVASVRKQELIVTTLSMKDRIRPSMICLLYREGEEFFNPVTNESLGKDYEIIGKALIKTVSKTMSEAAVIPVNNTLPQVSRGDLVVTK